MYMRTPRSFCLPFFPFFLSPRLSAVIGVLSAAAALSPYLFPHLPPHSFACAIGVLLDRLFVCRCCLVFSPTKRDTATTPIHSTPNGNASEIEIATTSTFDCALVNADTSFIPRHVPICLQVIQQL